MKHLIGSILKWLDHHFGGATASYHNEAFELRGVVS